MNADKDIVTVKLDGESFDDFMEDIKKEIQLKNYRVVKVINVDNIKMRRNLVNNLEIGFKSYKIIEICNLFTCNEIISADLRAGVFMPQRLALYERLDVPGVFVSYLKPTAVARLFTSKKMMVAAGKMEKDIEEILDTVQF